MKNQSFMFNLFNSVLLVLFGLLMVSAAGAAELVFSPRTPIVEVGQQITLSVSGTSGTVTWTPTKGQIQGSGNQVTYIAPAQAGLDIVTAFDSDGNVVGTVKITVMLTQTISLENANWEVLAEKFSDLPNWVLESDASGLWIGSKILGYYNASGEWTTYSESLLSRFHEVTARYEVTALEGDGSGGLWIGVRVTRDFGFLTYISASGELTNYHTENSGLPSNLINALEGDGNGGLWIGTDNGLVYRSSRSEWTVYNEVNSGLPDNLVNVLESDGSGGLWIGAGKSSMFIDWGFLVYRSSRSEWTVYHRHNSELPSNTVTALKSDGSSGLWIGTADPFSIGVGGGLVYRSASGKWTVYNEENSALPSNYVVALENDGNGGLWIEAGGIIHLTFGQKSNLVQTIQDEAISTAILTEKRAAILIHPRSQGTGYNQAVSIEFIATYVYRTIQTRGYDNDEIYFLSYKPEVDINGDGLVDKNVVDGPITAFDLAAGTPPRDLTHADIQQAFEWAKQKGKLDQPLLVIFVGDALTGQLRLDSSNEVLTAQDLDGILTDYQQATSSQVVVILEACHTGSLISGLAAPNRIIVTSTADDFAYYDNLGSFSFSKFFFDNLRSGDSFYDAFQTVKGKLPTYGHPFNLQAPQLDDDGDGIANTSNDGRLARKLCLNGCFGALSSEITLKPETPAATVTTGQSISLVVRAGITEGHIKRVWALVMTPETAKRRNEQGFSLVPTPVVNLSQKPEDVSRWQGSFSDFQYQGDYVVTFMAEDNEGFITTTKPFTLTLPEGPDVPEIVSLAQKVYHNGDIFRVTLPPLPEGQAQYVGVALLEEGIFVLADLNGFTSFDGVTLPVWQGGEVAIEVPVSAGIPRGEYTLYLLRVPVGVEPLASQAQWALGVSTFKME